MSDQVLLVTGATGLIGHYFLTSLPAECQLILLSRTPSRARQILADIPQQKINYIASLDDIAHHQRIDAIINLAGEPIADKRWSDKQKQRIETSRWQLTEQLVALIERLEHKPSVMLSGSAVGYYGLTNVNPITEQTAPCPGDFGHQLCEKWERIALQAQSDQTRVCLLRTGIVLAANGGALAKMLPAFKLGLGGTISHGQQPMPWIHIADMIAAMLFLLEHADCQGPFNLCAPHPVSNAEFCTKLAKRLSRPCWLPLPGPLLKLLMGEMSQLLLQGQATVPDRLQQAGFQFVFTDLNEAFNDLIA